MKITFSQIRNLPHSRIVNPIKFALLQLTCESLLDQCIFASGTPVSKLYLPNAGMLCPNPGHADWGVRVVSRNVIKSQHLWQASHLLPA